MEGPLADLVQDPPLALVQGLIAGLSGRLTPRPGRLMSLVRICYNPPVRNHRHTVATKTTTLTLSALRHALAREKVLTGAAKTTALTLLRRTLAREKILTDAARTTALTLSALRQALEQEKVLARTDPLTGAANLQAFREKGGLVLTRAHRNAQPLTMVYIDLDGFKALNDRRGHKVGDDCLKAVAGMVRSQLRATDLLARIGGDEFAVLLPGTGPDRAGEVLDGLRQALLSKMRRRGWPVTFSIGATTFAKAPAALDKIVQQADTLMYSVKQDGKDGVILRMGSA